LVKQVKVLALIPARGGSKSIPRKNIRLFAGHPLVAYSICAALAAKTINRIVVSTDDSEIAEISRSYGAETPFMRPAEFSSDNTPDYPVFHHALTWFLEHEGYQPDIIVQLRPTSPLRRVQHIDRSVKLLNDHSGADSVRTVCVPFQNPFKMWRVEEDGFLEPLLATQYHEPYNMPRQLLPEVYWQTGYVDATRSQTILQKQSMTGDHILPLIIEPGEWIDIDSQDDWQRAETLLQSGGITIEELGFQPIKRKI
jgi:CMP-N-acetylneuraminic acid synthetase